MAGANTSLKTKSSVPGAWLRLVEQGEPQRGPSDHEPGRGHDPSAAPVPGAVPAAEAGRELQRAQEREHPSGEDVEDESRGEPVEPAVRGEDGRSAGDLDQPESAGREGEGGQGDQCRRDPPAPAAPPVTGRRGAGPGGRVGCS